MRAVLRSPWYLGICGILLCSLAIRSKGAHAEKFGGAAPASSKVIIEYPLEGSVFPPEITAPTFLFRDENETAKHWVVDVTLDRVAGIRVETSGEHLQMGEIDTKAGVGKDLVELTPEQKATLIWKPDEQTWTAIKQGSVKHPATITVTGFADDQMTSQVSSGSVRISTSVDPVGAPIFYRDVPLLLSAPNAKGEIAPLPPFALPLIKWKLRSIAEPQSKTVMENLPTCGNCHSFSADGKTLGLDLDGPKNDKGLYAIAPVSAHMTIRNRDVIRWSSFEEEGANGGSEPTAKRFGFMSQVSPDGNYVVTSIAPPKLAITHTQELKEFVPGLADRLFSIVYKDVPFAQVFYPTRGILAVYDRTTKKLTPLPGADDPKYVHTSAFWSPDGKYLIFSRAEARDPYPPGPKAEYANDPRETQIQYDLYKIPFNDGHGGKAEPVVGASQNGMSNNFPKVTPDGKWIVFVQNKNGLLMRPDSKLFMVPFAGGRARLMNCNTWRMNSWHTFSPNGRWMAFSSKGRTPYTQLMLTHIDEKGNDTPAIMVENTTLANRAVNIPEFVNIPADGLEKIDPQATEFYRLFNQAFELMESNKMPEALPLLREAVVRDPDDALGHYALATVLTATNKESEAVGEYRKACTLNTKNAAWFAHLATSLALNGEFDEAVTNWKKSLAIDPSNAGAEADMGAALFQMGHAEDGYAHLKKAVEMAPNFADGHSRLGWILAKSGRANEAIAELEKAIELNPNSVDYRANLAYVQASRGDFTATVATLEKAVALSDGRDWRCLDMLANAYEKVGRSAEAVQSEQRAVDLAAQQHDAELEKHLRGSLQQFQEDVARAQGK